MNYAIIDYKQKDGKIDFNNAILDTPNGQHFLQHLTDKGYYSKKPLYINFEYTYYNDSGVDCLIISKKTFKYLFDNYTNLNGKIFETYEKRKKRDKAVGVLAWCNVMKDPYDIG